MARVILADDDYFDLIDDVDADFPACQPGCPCPNCAELDRDEAALLARLRDADAAGCLDLGALAIAAGRPWREGEAA